MASSDTTLASLAGYPHSPVAAEALSRPPAAVSSRENQPAADEWLRIMGHCFGQLDEGHRRVLTLRTRFNLSYEEIAAEMQTHAGSVRESVRRAREHLRALLIQNSPEFSQADTTVSTPAG
jgi:RNA polymerase sigma factor (sigma-70 family)